MVIESTFHLSEEVVKALKLKAVNENKKFSRVAEEGLRQYLGRVVIITVFLEVSKCVPLSVDQLIL
ncbi:MAG: hypothetical protein WBZ36_11120 [Candidatus Nitrosopolaris sp.]